ncbi:unnamed protein product [Amoebophrya sp. A120]|nr:unnamed protein product [Amoebophrya sp. A120]|eukprot:GSA120T00020124001.1
MSPLMFGTRGGTEKANSLTAHNGDETQVVAMRSRDSENLVLTEDAFQTILTTGDENGPQGDHAPVTILEGLNRNRAISTNSPSMEQHDGDSPTAGGDNLFSPGGNTRSKNSSSGRAPHESPSSASDRGEMIGRMTSAELNYASAVLRKETEKGLQQRQSERDLADDDSGEEVTYMNPSLKKKDAKKVGAFAGVFVPTCENMWGVLIFLRFYTIVGNAGVGLALLAVFLSFSMAFLTASSMSAVVSSGGFVSEGGPYYMISRAMGPAIGVTVGLLYWLGISLLAVLETLGAVEALLIARPELNSGGAMRGFGSIVLLGMVLMVYMGIKFVTKMGVVFVVVVFFTLLMFYVGIFMTDGSETATGGTNFKGPDGQVTGISASTLETNLGSHFGDGVDFGVVMSLFFPCFTGILSGANRADILKNPPRDLKVGTLGAITFSLVMYSTFMIFWGAVAKYPYLRGDWEDCNEAEDELCRQKRLLQDETSFSTYGVTTAHATTMGESFAAEVGTDAASTASAARRNLAGGSAGAYVFEEIAWTPFPYAPHIGIIISSISQALQCLIVAPRLLQAIARDNVIPLLNDVAPLSRHGEPIRALFYTYVVCAALVLVGELNLVAPLLTMCFLACYINMNLSCFILTWLKAPSWRPAGIQRKRWRIWYKVCGLTGAVLGVVIMFIVQWAYALVTCFLAVGLYVYVDFRAESSEWGSGLDGIKFHLALNSLLSLEETQRHKVNWRPQVLILYRVHMADLSAAAGISAKRTRHHEILQFYSQLRKGRGMCVVAAVLEGNRNSEKMLKKARIEKDIIISIMKQNDILGFAQVVVAPTWAEGANYILQLTGLGGLVPNTVLMAWPSNWASQPLAIKREKAVAFCDIVTAAHAEDKTILIAKDPKDFPLQPCHGTIDVWWMIHDGGLMILVTWLLQQHKIWRDCKMRVFTVMENITEEEASIAARVLTQTLQKKRLLNVDVEVIMAEHAFVEPFSHHADHQNEHSTLDLFYDSIADVERQAAHRERLSGGSNGVLANGPYSGATPGALVANGMSGNGLLNEADARADAERAAFLEELEKMSLNSGEKAHRPHRGLPQTIEDLLPQKKHKKSVAMARESEQINIAARGSNNLNLAAARVSGAADSAIGVAGGDSPHATNSCPDIVVTRDGDPRFSSSSATAGTRDVSGRAMRKKSFSVLTVGRDDEVIEATTPGGHILRDRKVGTCDEDEEQIVIRELQCQTAAPPARNTEQRAHQNGAGAKQQATTKVVRVDQINAPNGNGGAKNGGIPPGRLSSSSSASADGALAQIAVAKQGSSSRSYDADAVLLDEGKTGGDRQVPHAVSTGAVLVAQRNSAAPSKPGDMRSVDDIDLHLPSEGLRDQASSATHQSSVSWGRHFQGRSNPVTIALQNETRGGSNSRQGSKGKSSSLPEIPEQHSLLAFRRLNSIIQARSRRAELVIMNLPDLWDHSDPNECVRYIRCAETLVDKIDRVLFVHGSGHEVFDIGA